MNTFMNTFGFKWSEIVPRETHVHVLTGLKFGGYGKVVMPVPDRSVHWALTSTTFRAIHDQYALYTGKDDLWKVVNVHLHPPHMREVRLPVFEPTTHVTMDGIPPEYLEPPKVVELRIEHRDTDPSTSTGRQIEQGYYQRPYD